MREIQARQQPRDFLPNQRSIVALLEPHIAPQEVDDGLVRCCLTVGRAPRFEKLSARVLMGAEEFGEEPGLADAGLPDDPHHLTPATLGVCSAGGQDHYCPRAAHKPAALARSRRDELHQP